MEANPLYLSFNDDEEDIRSRVLGSASMQWTPATWLNVSGNFSYDRSDRNRTAYHFKGYRTINPSSLLNDGRLRMTNNFTQFLTMVLNASTTHSIGDLSVATRETAWAGRSSGGMFQATARDLAVTNVRDLDMGDPERSTVTGSSDGYRSLGYSAGTQLEFKDRYIADLSFSRDGSSLFGLEERWHGYHRLSGAYVISDEPFWPFGFLDLFKLRYSYGTAGGYPSYLAQYETYNVEGGIVSKDRLGNRRIKPERAAEHEFGVDLIAAGRFSLGLTRALSTVSDQILLVPLPGVYGYGGGQWRNAGTLESNTWEGTLRASIVQTRDLSWDFNFVIDKTRQQISEFDLPGYITRSAFYIRDGEMLGTMYGRRWATRCDEIQTTSGLGVACDQFEMNDDGYLVAVGADNTWTDGIDQNLYGSKVTIDGSEFDFGMPFHAREEKVDSMATESGFLTSSDTTNFLRMGSSIPDANFGFTSTIRWKSITLYTMFDAQIGGDVYNNTRQWAYRELNAWEVDQSGKTENHRKPIEYYNTLYDVNASNSHFVEDATYLKFREMSIQYTFNRNVLEHLFGGRLQRVSISFIGRNIKTWTNYTGFDPEVSTTGDAGIYRFDGFGYPNYRTWTGAVEIEF